MIPIRTDVPVRRVSVVVLALVAVNVWVFLVELGKGPALESFLLQYGLVPADWVRPGQGLLERLSPFVSSMFLHGGWLHVIGNLWFLYIFGRNVEDRLGPVRFAVLYFFCGVAAGALHVMANQGSSVPTIGASGAIAGVMGAYLVLYPRSRIETLSIFFIIPVSLRFPAVLFLGVWFLSQVFSGTLSLAASFDTVAWWAHVGGFLAGIYWALRFVPGRRAGRRRR